MRELLGPRVWHNPHAHALVAYSAPSPCLSAGDFFTIQCRIIRTNVVGQLLMHRRCSARRLVLCLSDEQLRRLLRWDREPLPVAAAPPPKEEGDERVFFSAFEGEAWRNEGLRLWANASVRHDRHTYHRRFDPEEAPRRPLGHRASRRLHTCPVLYAPRSVHALVLSLLPHGPHDGSPFKRRPRLRLQTPLQVCTWCRVCRGAISVLHKG